MQIRVQIGHQLLSDFSIIVGEVMIYQGGNYSNITFAKHAKLINSQFYTNTEKSYQWYDREYDVPVGSVLKLHCVRRYQDGKEHNAVAYLKVAGLHRKVWYAPAFSDGVWGGMVVGCVDWLESGIELKHANSNWNKREFFKPDN